MLVICKIIRILYFLLTIEELTLLKIKFFYNFCPYLYYSTNKANNEYKTRDYRNNTAITGRSLTGAFTIFTTTGDENITTNTFVSKSTDNFKRGQGTLGKVGKMINLQEVLEVHQILLQKFGGMQGIREEGLLHSALERPFGGFGEEEFYPSTAQKAGAVLESIVKNHPFADGNKRTGYVLMRLLLMYFGEDMKATQGEKYDFVIAVASGEMNFEEIVSWIRTHQK